MFTLIKLLRRQEYFLSSLVFLLGLVLLLFRLDYTSLHPWDEAWYASISRNVLRGHIFDLWYNGSLYWDHPPLGFYVTAFSQYIFGINEFSSRFPMVIFGSFCLVTAFSVGKRLGNLFTGISSALILLSTRWFLLRARTGNLDVLLLLTQLLTFFLAFSARTYVHLILLWIGFGLSLMTKTAISIMLSPLVFLATRRVFRAKKLTYRHFLKLAIPFGIITLPWYVYNLARYGDSFLNRHFIEVGLRSGHHGDLGFSTLEHNLVYFRSAVHKWYLPTFISIIFGLFF